MQSLQGQLLVASPHMGESPFAQTVILVLHHSEEGAFGVVLNRPIGESVKSLWDQVSEKPCACERPLNMGGPVSGPLMALHGEASLSEMEVQVPGGVYVAASREHLEQLVCEATLPCRIFIGHAGWTAGQLENELQAGVWMISPATFEQVFSDDEDLWTTVLRQIGRDILHSTLKIKHVPRDISWN
ncbi:MAG: YqgE/AlgH family protein [Planctomycetes bacterium]|nr:YqgE/AlgH family protein [Planctomycetota bacterium]